MLSNGEKEHVQMALLSSSLYDSDWKWVEAQCIVFTHHNDPEIQASAIIALGHLARIHGKLHLAVIKPLLLDIAHDPFLNGVAQDTLDDIAIFIEKSTRSP